MEIGSLKQRITLEKPVTTVNDRGFEEKTWQEVATVWAKAENLRGREYYAAAAVQAENTVTFTIRYRPGVDTDLRLLFRGKHYRINAVNNVNYESRSTGKPTASGNTPPMRTAKNSAGKNPGLSRCRYRWTNLP